MAAENLAEIIAWKYNASPLRDFEVCNGKIRLWSVPGVAKPTEEEVLAFEADWIAAGGAITRFRAQAAAMIDELRQSGSMALRAVVIETLAYANAQRAAFNSLLTWLSNQGTLTQRAQLAAMQLTQATPAQARTAIKSRMTKGEADS